MGEVGRQLQRIGEGVRVDLNHPSHTAHKDKRQVIQKKKKRKETAKKEEQLLQTGGRSVTGATAAGEDQKQEVLR